MRRGRGGTLRRAISSIVATVMLVGMTVTAGALLWAFRPPIPPAPSSIEYVVYGNLTEPTWGDGSDCTTVSNVQQCQVLPAFAVVITQASPSVMALAQLSFVLVCNGTVYLTATLQQMAWVPGTPASIGAGAPQLGKCGTYTPPGAAFNRLAFFQQLVPGSGTLREGDAVFVYAHTFTTFKDDDYHGVPSWCYTIQGACTLSIEYTGAPSVSVIAIPLFGMSS